MHLNPSANYSSVFQGVHFSTIKKYFKRITNQRMAFKVAFIISIVVLTLTSVAPYPLSEDKDTFASADKFYHSTGGFAYQLLSDEAKITEQETSSGLFKKIENLEEQNIELQKKLATLIDELHHKMTTTTKLQKVANVQLQETAEDEDLGFWYWLGVTAKRLLNGVLNWFGINIY